MLMSTLFFADDLRCVDAIFCCLETVSVAMLCQQFYLSYLMCSWPNLEIF